MINRRLADSGLLKYTQSSEGLPFHELSLLKGLKDEDREAVLMYRPGIL